MKLTMRFFDFENIKMRPRTGTPQTSTKLGHKTLAPSPPTSLLNPASLVCSYQYIAAKINRLFSPNKEKYVSNNTSRLKCIHKGRHRRRTLRRVSTPIRR